MTDIPANSGAWLTARPTLRCGRDVLSFVTDPQSGLRLFELSHPWGHGVPVSPGDADVSIVRSVYFARDGVMSQKFVANMHASTHLNAPIHLVQGGEMVGALPLEHFFGNAAILSIPKGRWELVSADDLAQATPQVREGDMVLIVTGWHRKFSDSEEYFGEAPGLSKEAAQWLVDRKVRLVGMDTPQIDHPMATSYASHRGGPLMKRLPKFYASETARDPKEDFPEWIPAHKLLLVAGVPTIENVGGDVDALLGQRCTCHAMPWRWMDGDACVVRLMAMVDPTGSYRIESGMAG